MNMFPSALFFVVLATLLYYWFFHFRHWHIGFGWVLVRKESDGTVWVVSRLIRSPSGKGGVRLFSQVAFIDGVEMSFRSYAEFEAWERDAKPKRGEESVCIFADGEVVRMTPVLIRERIPVYWSPNMKTENLPRYYATYGLGWCDKTEQYIYTSRLSREVVRETFYG